MKLVTKYQISAINSYWEKCDEKYLGRTEGQTDRRTEVCSIINCIFDMYWICLFDGFLVCCLYYLLLWGTNLFLQYNYLLLLLYWLSTKNIDRRWTIGIGQTGRIFIPPLPEEGGVSWTDGRTDGQTDRGKTVYPPPSSGSGGIKILPVCPMPMVHLLSIFFVDNQCHCHYYYYYYYYYYCYKVSVKWNYL
jgi:hypothetical protein